METQAPYIANLLPPELSKMLDWKTFFGSDAPVEVEIGCGKGKFLAARAAENPGTNFLGIDRVIKWMKRRIKQTAGTANLKFFKAEAGALLKNIPLESVRYFHVYFPDPWPKRRHRGRRFLDERSMQDLFDRLEPGGSIYLATDDSDYFQQIRKSADSVKGAREIVEARSRMVGPSKTNYELKFEAEGRPLYYLEVRK